MKCIPGYLLRAACLIGLLITFQCSAQETSACRIKGVAREVLCGTQLRPENPDQPAGRSIEIKFAVMPALAKNKEPDAIFVFAGGPGQSAIHVAAQVLATQSKLNNRRDFVFVDQRGTGGSNRLGCPQPAPSAPLAQQLDVNTHERRLRTCIQDAIKQGHDLRQYATWIAVRDIDAVRAALGIEQINLYGSSYGTRAALEYLRQFPQHVRSVVLDGVAPADMVLPTSFAQDSDAVLTELIKRCSNNTECAARYPNLNAHVNRLLRQIRHNALRMQATHPVTGKQESLVLDQNILAAALRTPLYLPVLAAGLPHAITRAAEGDPNALIALSMALSDPGAGQFGHLMHFAVVCAEDLPLLDQRAQDAAAATRFGNTFDATYRHICPRIPVRPVPQAFYLTPDTQVPVLMLSGGLDPATPPRHASSIARQLSNSKHIIAPHLGHGVAAHGCAPELIARFVATARLEDIDGSCLARLPAPTFFLAPRYRQYP